MKKKSYCIVINCEYGENTIKTNIQEIGDTELKENLTEYILQEILSKLRMKIK